MSTDDQDQHDTLPRRRDDDEVHPAVPYLVVLGVGAIIALALLVYLWSYRVEIIRIVTQSPV